MSLTGSCFSSESAPGPFHHGVRERGGTIYWAALPSIERQVQADIRSHLIHRPARDIIPPRGGARVFSYLMLCGCHAATASSRVQRNVGAVDPDAVHDHGQPTRQRHDRLLHAAAPGHVLVRLGGWVSGRLQALRERHATGRRPTQRPKAQLPPRQTALVAPVHSRGHFVPGWVVSGAMICVSAISYDPRAALKTAAVRERAGSEVLESSNNSQLIPASRRRLTIVTAVCPTDQIPVFAAL